ncbi:Hypothetical protein BSM4216_3372 [Bacillus smithii]|jgi:hypothetical protein|nr:Hypothetical protein BSM4216_3372 [Bacillus smithii]
MMGQGIGMKKTEIANDFFNEIRVGIARVYFN